MYEDIPRHCDCATMAPPPAAATAAPPPTTAPAAAKLVAARAPAATRAAPPPTMANCTENIVLHFELFKSFILTSFAIILATLQRRYFCNTISHASRVARVNCCSA